MTDAAAQTVSGGEAPLDAAQAFRQRLRAATGARHAALDRRFAGIEAGRDAGLYHRFIRVSDAVHRTLEPILAASPLPDRMGGWSGRERAAVLALDLRAMGLKPLAAPPFAIPAPRLPEAIGIAYVLEGSRLGARMMHRSLAPRAGHALSLRYLASAEETDFFRPFLARGAWLLPEPADQALAGAAARAAFDHVLAVTDAAERAERAAAEGVP